MKFKDLKPGDAFTFASPDSLNGAMRGPCVHAGGQVSNTQTTASWVAELTPAGAHHWATGTAAP